MEDPANGVVDCLALGERLVTALVGDDPEAGHDEAVGERIQRPEREAGEGVEVRARQGDVLGRDECIKVIRSLPEGRDKEEVPDAVVEKLTPSVTALTTIVAL